MNYLDWMPCFTSPPLLLNTSAIPIAIFIAIAAMLRIFIKDVFAFVS
jgi:hypothetical protein